MSVPTLHPSKNTIKLKKAFARARVGEGGRDEAKVLTELDLSHDTETNDRNRCHLVNSFLLFSSANRIGINKLAFSDQ